MSGIKLGQGKRTIRNIKSNVIDPHCVAWRDEQGMVWPPGLCCRNIEELLKWVKAWFPLVASPGGWCWGCPPLASPVHRHCWVTAQRKDKNLLSIHPEVWEPAVYEYFSPPWAAKANQSKPKHGGSTPSSPAVMSHSKVLYSFSFRHSQLTQIWVKLWDFKRKMVQKSLGLIKKMKN